MPCTITYPGATGAVDSGSLVCCCGTYSGVTGTPHIYGRMYGASETPPAKPPDDAVEGEAAGGFFHFNATKIPNASDSGSQKVAVWITGDGDNCYLLDEQVFDGCVYGPGCSPPDDGHTTVCATCAEDEPVHLPVIDCVAPAAYVLEVDAHLLGLAAARSGDLAELVKKAFAVELRYSHQRSTYSRAFWIAAEPKDAAEKLKLEVVRHSQVRLCATMYFHPEGKTQVHPPQAWFSDHFQLNRGGTLWAVDTHGQKVGGAVRLAPLLPPQKPAEKPGEKPARGAQRDAGA